MKEKEDNERLSLTGEITFCLQAIATHVWNTMVQLPKEKVSWSASNVYNRYCKVPGWIEKDGVDLRQEVCLSIVADDASHEFNMCFALHNVFRLLDKYEKMQTRYKSIKFTEKAEHYDYISGEADDAQNWYWCGTSVKLRDGFPGGDYDYREPNNKKLHHPVTTIKISDWYEEHLRIKEKYIRQQILEKGSRWFFMFNG